MRGSRCLMLIALALSTATTAPGGAPAHPGKADDRPDSVRIASAPPSDAWLVYRSPRYCYQIRYPREAAPDTTDPSAVRFVFSRDVTADGIPNAYTNRFWLTLFVQANPRRLSARKCVAAREAGRTVDSTGPSLQDLVRESRTIHIGGTPGFRMRVFGYDQDTDWVYVARDTQIYALSFPKPYPDTPGSSDALLWTFEEMMESFTLVGGRGCGPVPRGRGD